MSVAIQRDYCQRLGPGSPHRTLAGRPAQAFRYEEHLSTSSKRFIEETFCRKGNIMSN